MAALIAAQRAQDGIPHAVACRALGVSRSWFYKHKDEQAAAAGAAAGTAQSRDRAAVRRGMRASTGPRGSPLTCAMPGWRVSENTVAALDA